MDLVVRRPRTVLAIWTLVVAVPLLVHPPASSWAFFHNAAALLVGDAPSRLGAGGLHLWRTHPEMQFGPVTVLVAVVFHSIGGAHDAWVARLAVFPLAPVLVWLVADAARATRPALDERVLRRSTVLAGLVFVPMWDYLALSSLHLDDAVAMTTAVLAVWAVARRHPVVAAVALGAAANAKPWAVVFLPLVWALPAEERRRAATIAVGVAVLPWVPFLLGAPGTLTALRSFRIHTAPTSVLRVLGVHDAMTPVWDRPLQVVAGLAAAAVAARRQWAGVLLVGIAVRLLLDPGTHLYYTAGMVTAALVWDLLGSRSTIPWMTLLSAAALQLPRILGAPAAVSGWLRLAVTVYAVVAVLAPSAALVRPAPRRRPELAGVGS